MRIQSKFICVRQIWHYSTFSIKLQVMDASTVLERRLIFDQWVLGLSTFEGRVRIVRCSRSSFEQWVLGLSSKEDRVRIGRQYFLGKSMHWSNFFRGQYQHPLLEA
ncbi:uncharacterized protein LOC118648606 [Monomorium pharaonis]|uniref:uncharacterized protein LOC118648606 n=1 Tax=Monomorium pharaonis TaxID=307658 RepID=UPI001746DC1E|nr:uncharacterized protein LOC118648606 [Monomorium pharaonis]XP_036150828.1 uncharacterized protein LOC118648606 [Monomorium pharaonis]